jgi:hypothetical protein
VSKRRSYRRALGAGLVTAMLSSCGMANPSPLGAQETSTAGTSTAGTSTAGCHLPVRDYEPKSTFIGVKAIARNGVPSKKLAIGFRAERARWCVLSFVIDERNYPFSESVYFLSNASNGDVVAVIAYMKRTGLFAHVGVLRPRVYPYANQ